MLGRWFYSRLRSAERALREGRLDDAYAVAREAEEKSDARVRALRDGLARPLLGRARLHRQAGRHAEALADLDRLEIIGRLTPDADALRADVRRERDARNVSQAEQRDAVARAADRIRAGRLETGRLDLQNVRDDTQRQRLAQDLERRAERAHATLARAAAALDGDNVLLAIQHWQDACRRHGRSGETDAFAARLTPTLRAAITEWHRAGRLESLLAARDGVAALLSHEPTLVEEQRLLELCARAATQLAEDDLANLRHTLLRVQAVGGEVDWVRAGLNALALVSEGHEKLLATPLGLCASTPGPPHPPRAAAEPTAENSTPVRVSSPWTEPALVLVDGGGSSVLFPNDRLRIGRAGTSGPIDIALPADIHSHHADIVRRGEDYFLTAYGPAEVNHRAIDHVLLRHGDRVKLGGRARLTFEQPSSMTTSAVLRLSHRCRLAQDVSNVVLFRDVCLVGPDASCHVRTSGVDGRVVLFVREGRLHGRATNASGVGHSASVVLSSERVQDFGDVRITLKSYDAHTADPGRVTNG